MLTLSTKCSFIFITEGSLVDKTDLLALYLSGTYCHKTGKKTPSCPTPRQPTIYDSEKGSNIMSQCGPLKIAHWDPRKQCFNFRESLLNQKLKISPDCLFFFFFLSFFSFKSLSSPLFFSSRLNWSLSPTILPLSIASLR